jgi:hypothetical protein
MQTEERARREDLLFQIGKKEYDAIVDKKRCPKCGAKKSYDEVKEKKKLCPNCKVLYCPIKYLQAYIHTYIHAFV